MEKRAISLLLVLCVLSAWLPIGVLAADTSGEFTIENGVLTKYNGEGRDVVIPDGVTEIGEGAFAECSELASVVIPKSVTRVGAGAFMGCAGLVGIALPDRVTSIGAGAFADCGGLISITIPDGVTHIEDNVFIYCGSLKSVTLPDSVTSIGHGAFGECTSLTNITLPDNLTTIEDAAFSGCTTLTDIMIPKGVTSMGSAAFEESGLSAFTVAEGNQTYKAVDGVLYNKAGTELLRYPPRKGGNKYTVLSGVTSIGDYAFMNCRDLTEITLTDNLMNIGDNAFAFCGDLLNVKIPDSVTSLGFGAFQECSSLTEVTVPESVESIGDFAFCDCDNLTSVTILNPAVKFADSYWVFGYPTTAAIYGYAGSTAETYCEMYKGIFESTFISLGDAPAPAKALTDSMVSLPDGYGATYDKTAHTPTVTVKDGDKTLVPDTDYTVVYQNNVNAGEATVTVTGIGGYKGNVAKTFTISPANLTGTLMLTRAGDSGQAMAGDVLTLEMMGGGEFALEDGAFKLKDGNREIPVTVAWLRDGESIEGAGGLSYTITGDDRGKSIAARITPRDLDNYTGALTAAAVSVAVPIEEPEPPVEEPDPPTDEPAPPAASSDSVPAVPRRAISVKKTDNGSVSLSAERAKRGDTITVTVAPDEGWKLESLTVTDRNQTVVALADMGGGKYIFAMPGTAVTVTPIFTKEAIPAELPKETPPETTPDISATAQFGDVKEADWFYDAVQYVFHKGMMSGLTEDAFGPGVHTGRAMVVTILYRMEGEPVTAPAGFTDVAENAYYYNAVSWGAERGIVKGLEDGTFRPDSDVTREQLAVMLFRYGSYKGWDMSERADLFEYSDAEQISAFALEAMSWAKSAGVISGTDWGGLHPGGSATRAETAAILMRCCENQKQD